jgi:hypothetical protein
MTPLRSCVWSGEMKRSPGSIPMPAGTVTRRPSTNTSRCSWIWSAVPSLLSAARSSARRRAPSSAPFRDQGALPVSWPGRLGGTAVVTVEEPPRATSARATAPVSRAAAAAAARRRRTSPIVAALASNRHRPGGGWRGPVRPTSGRGARSRGQRGVVGSSGSAVAVSRKARAAALERSSHVTAASGTKRSATSSKERNSRTTGSASPGLVT